MRREQATDINPVCWFTSQKIHLVTRLYRFLGSKHYPCSVSNSSLWRRRATFVSLVLITSSALSRSATTLCAAVRCFFAHFVHGIRGSFVRQSFLCSSEDPVIVDLRWSIPKMATTILHLALVGAKGLMIRFRGLLVNGTVSNVFRARSPCFSNSWFLSLSSLFAFLKCVSFLLRSCIR